MKFDALHFRDEDAARAYVEALRWPQGRVCGKCGSFKSYETKKPGRYRCGEPQCRKDFTVMTGTVMEASHVRLTVWLMAFYLMASSKKGMSAHQLHRSLDVTYKTAWFLAHRIREAMKAGGLASPMGGAGSIIEADETYYGATSEMMTSRKTGSKFLRSRRGRGSANKRAIVSLVERGGSVRSFHVASADKETVQKIIRENVDPASRLHTDESRLYPGASVAQHEHVKHSIREYARGDVNTNSVEGYFSVFKRGMRGTYQHCAEKHLHRYLAEFDFRHNNRTALGITDNMRAKAAIQGIEGKRLTYRRTNEAR
ncbi:MAG: IS1595 family transposase [Caulobacterales bacterium]